MEVITSIRDVRHELRFQSLHRQGRGWAFPCNAQGDVDLDRLSERARNNYFFARALMGHDYTYPCVQVIV